MKPEVGLQFSLSELSTPQLNQSAQLALSLYDFDQIWLSDNLQFRNAFVGLTSLAMNVQCSLGLGITFPYARNPIDTASAVASICELMGERKFSLGFGPGGYLYEVLGVRRSPAKAVREHLHMVKLLLQGASVRLGDYQTLCGMFGLKPDAKAKLEFPPPKNVQFYVAAGGPRMLELAGRFGDGVIFNMMTPVGSRSGMTQGIFDRAVEDVLKASESSNRSSPLKKIYLAHFSTATDATEAKNLAIRNVCYAIAESRDDWLKKIGIEPAEARRVREVFDRGLDLDAAAAKTIDKMAQAYAIAGTPGECAEQLAQIVQRVADWDQVIIDLAVSPNLPETLRLVAKEVLPSVF